jgi:hypothetical protein
MKKTDYIYGKNNGIFLDVHMTPFQMFSLLPIFEPDLFTLNREI